jgi:hypothetical protein
LYYTIYEVENILNNKIYIGMHQTKKLNDGYLGSGKRLKYAVAKYGKNNFIKRFLYIFLDKQSMIDKEKEIVTEEFCSREDTYNIAVGGKGGFSFFWRGMTKEEIVEHNSKISPYGTPEHIEKYGIGNSYGLENLRNHNLKVSLGLRSNGFKNKIHSKETKLKMSESSKKSGLGSKNSQFGTMWITNGIINKKVKKDLYILEEGWYKGRTLNTRAR